MPKIRTIAVITNDQFFRDASTYFLSQQQYAVLDIGQDEQEICVQLLHQRPDLVILHTGSGSALGTCALRCIAEHQLLTKTLAYCDEASKPPALLHASLTRADGLDAMLRCVAMLEGAPTAPAPLAAPVPNPLAVLTPQELKVLAMIGQGWGSGQMAEQLFVSMHTIKNHKSNIKRKLAVASGRELLSIALTLRSHSDQIRILIPARSTK